MIKLYCKEDFGKERMGIITGYVPYEDQTYAVVNFGGALEDVRIQDLTVIDKDEFKYGS